MSERRAPWRRVSVRIWHVQHQQQKAQQQQWALCCASSLLPMPLLLLLQLYIDTSWLPLFFFLVLQPLVLFQIPLQIVSTPFRQVLN